MSVEIKTEQELSVMRQAGRIVAEILDELEKVIAPGVTTWDLDQLAERLTLQKGARPAFKGYGPSHCPFPGVLCASVNEEVVHGIPSKKRKLKAGDLMKLDFGVRFQGFFGDSARTVAVGQVSEEAQRLIAATRESLDRAISQVQVGKRIGDVAHAVQKHVESRGFAVVRDFVGHGIGKSLHEPPQIPNYGDPDTGMKLKVGMVLAIEPMVNAGTHRVEVLDDEWTAITADKKLSAHFEHTVALTEKGPEVLTRSARR